MLFQRFECNWKVTAFNYDSKYIFLSIVSLFSIFQCTVHISDLIENQFGETSILFKMLYTEYLLKILKNKLLLLYYSMYYKN